MEMFGATRRAGENSLVGSSIRNPEEDEMSRFDLKNYLRRDSIAAAVGSVMVLALLLGACAPAPAAGGALTTIALPHDWCNYEGVFTGSRLCIRILK
jgi:hypothetical protein